MVHHEFLAVEPVMDEFRQRAVAARLERGEELLRYNAFVHFTGAVISSVVDQWRF
jgi:hypothetical protein